jgi:hypothetical protein
VPGIDAVEPDLTLRGIRYAWQAARSRSRSGQPAGAAEPAEAGER